MVKLIGILGVAVVLVGLVLYRPSDTPKTGAIKTSTRSSSVELKVRSSRKPCPIKKIRPGMQLEDVRSQLARYVMDYRGTRQDEDIYYVDGGVCRAFIDFNSQDHMVDSIDYDQGWEKIEFRNKATTTNVSTQSAADPNTNSGSATPQPNAAKGFPVSEDVFINAYVLANKPYEDLDDDQLSRLGHDEYHMARDIDFRLLSLMGTTRSKRALDLLDRTSKLHKQWLNYAHVDSE